MLFQSWTTQNLAVARFVFAKTEAAADTAEGKLHGLRKLRNTVLWIEILVPFLDNCL